MTRILGLVEPLGRALRRLPQSPSRVKAGMSGSARLERHQQMEGGLLKVRSDPLNPRGASSGPPPRLSAGGRAAANSRGVDASAPGGSRTRVRLPGVGRVARPDALLRSCRLVIDHVTAGDHVARGERTENVAFAFIFRSPVCKGVAADTAASPIAPLTCSFAQIEASRLSGFRPHRTGAGWIRSLTWVNMR